MYDLDVFLDVKNSFSEKYYSIKNKSISMFKNK